MIGITLRFAATLAVIDEPTGTVGTDTPSLCVESCAYAIAVTTAVIRQACIDDDGAGISVRQGLAGPGPTRPTLATCRCTKCTIGYRLLAAPLDANAATIVSFAHC